MLTIGIEINHVIRNINRQLLKYYQKEFDPSLDIDELDDKVDVFEKYLKFKGRKEKNNFIYIDYPFEIFGSAKAIDKKLPVEITNWLTTISNIEEEDIRIVLYSLNEEALTIQSTFFFLSKLGTRIRKVIFPKTISEVWKECDFVITTNNDMFDEPENAKRIILINREFNKENQDKAYMTYDSLSDVIKDNNFLKKLIDEKRGN